MLNQYKKIAYERIGSKDTGSSSGEGGATNDKDVIVLTDDNFD